MWRWIFRLFTHGVVLVVGFAAGIYVLPILTAEPGPSKAEMEQASADELFRGTFDRKLKGSDFLHWGDGEIRLTASKIVHLGSLAPGPNYKLYLVPDFADSKEAFLAEKDKVVQVGSVRSFTGFIIDVPPNVDVTAYTSVVIWCETFNAFITAAKYR
jgi:hypothetical protein